MYYLRYTHTNDDDNDDDDDDNDDNDTLIFYSIDDCDCTTSLVTIGSGVPGSLLEVSWKVSRFLLALSR